MEIDFKKLTDIFLQYSLEYAYHALTRTHLPEDKIEYDRFIVQYLEYLTKNDITLSKARKLSLTVAEIIDVPDCGLPVKRVRTKGFKSLTTVLDYSSVSSFCHGVYADGKKLVATDHHHLVIIDNSEGLPDGSITDPKTGELIQAKYPDYKSCIPKYDLFVEYDISLLLKKASDVVKFAKNTTNKHVIGLDFGVNCSAVDAKLLLQAMSVLDANGSKTVKVGFDKKNPQMPVTFQADNGNFAMIMPVVVDWEEPTIPILATIIGKKQEAKKKLTGEPQKTSQVPTIKSDEEKAVPTKSKKTKQGEPMVLMPLELVFIKSYCAWHGKVKTKTQVYAFIKRLQKAIVERRIRKDSGFAHQIEYIQNRLVAFNNDMKSGTKTYEIPEKWLMELKKLSNKRWADHVVVIKQYINILNQTKTGLKEKVQKLLKTIETSRYADIAKEAIEAITVSLKDYLSGKTETPAINEMTLQGLYGLAGLSGLGNLPASIPATSPANDNKVMSAADFKDASFKLMGFTGKWLQLIGNPSVPFKAMVWGTGGSGKSTLAIEFARYLAETLNKRVLYVANEEGAGATLHEKMTRLNAFHPNLFITKTLPPRLVEYDFIFCDSANSMQMELPKFEQTAKLYPQLSWVLLFQTTKDGKFLGEKNWQHAVDVEVYCETGKARALKSRFGGKETIQIY